MKKQTIRIFFACSTNSFSTEKKSFKKLFETLDDNSHDVTAKYEWCDSLEREDSLSQRISRHKADIVVYLIDKNFERNNKLLRDLKKNVQNRNHKILIYTPEGISKPIEEEIEKILKDNSLKFVPIKKIEILENCIEYNISLMQRKLKKINVYISCSTKNEDLNNQKKKITELCADLNNEYAEKKDNVSIKVVGYDDPESRDEVFRDFTKKTADIVVFLVDKDCGDEQKRLEDELDSVVERHKNESRPEILIYLPKEAEGSLSDKAKKILNYNQINIKRIEDTDSLKESVENNIQAYINSYDMLKNAKFLRSLKRTLIIGMAALVIGGVSIIAVFYYKEYIEASQPRLLIAGGGSAKNLINFEYLNEGDTNKKDKLEKIDEHWIYSPIPSRNACRLLTEETVMDIEENDYKNRNCYTVILSARKADIYDFLRCEKTIDPKIKKENIEDFKKIGVVIGIRMGVDPLVVYSKIQNTLSKMPKRISPDALKNSIISLGKDKLYTTNIGSGTLEAYNECLKDSIKPLDNHVFYSSNRIERDNNNKKWIALGSKYYSPKHVDLDSIDTTYVDSVEAKQVYIYFLKYKSVKNANYELPEATKKFLERIHINNSLIVSIKNLQPKNTDTTILFDYFCADKTCKDKSHTHFNKKKK